MKYFTGIDGSFYADGNKVATVSSWTFSANAAALDTTTLGDFATTSIYGIQSFTGSCTLYYYEKNAGAIEGGSLMSDVIRTTQTPTNPTHELVLRYDNGAKTHEVKFKCLLNQVQIAATAGDIVTASVNFQVTGPLQTATIA
nr:phage major tail protein 2 [uncultured Mediterranean phage uvMED]